MRELVSTALPGREWDQVLEYVVNQMIAQKSEGINNTLEAQPLMKSTITAKSAVITNKPVLTSTVKNQTHWKNLPIKMEYGSRSYPTTVGQWYKLARESAGPLF